MKATILDLRRRTRDILRALEQNEPVTILYRGKPKGVLVPIGQRSGGQGGSAADHPAFGMWADRDDLHDVDQFVRSIRKGRVRAD